MTSITTYRSPPARRQRCRAWICALTLFSLAAGTRAEDIFDAVRSNDIARVDALIDADGAEALQAAIGDGVTPLHLAAAMNETTIVGLLVCRGADVNARTAAGFTPLHWAASRDAADAAKILVAAGADINAKTVKGITPLHWAASKDAVHVVNCLVKAGASVSETTAAGLTPLHWAVMHSATDAAEVLSYKIVSDQMDREREAESAAAPAAKEEEGPAAAAPLEPETAPTPPEPAAPTVAVTERAAPESGEPRVVLGRVLKVDLGFHAILEFVWIERLGLWAGKYEVTNGQFRRFKPGHDSGSREAISLNGEMQPVVYVSWEDAQAFAEWLNHNFEGNLPEGCKFRLPTEAEWIALARCGDNRIYPWGNEWPPRYGNFPDLAARRRLTEWNGIRGYDDGYAVTCPVTASGANEWGLYGLAGNVWEWCDDWYDASHKYKVRHGGSWDFDTEPSLRIDARGFDRPDASYDSIGFRLVVSNK